MHARRRVLLLVVVFAWGMTWAAATPPAARGVSCPDQPLTVAELLHLRGDDELLEFQGFVNTAGRRCYGGADVRVVGYVDELPGMGWEGPWYLLPDWFAAPGLVLYGTRPSGDGPPGTYYNLAWPGEDGLLMDRYMHRWVVATAHFNDRNADRCRFKGPEPQTPSDASAVKGCHAILVISRLSLLNGPDTATAPVAPAGELSGGVADLERALLPIAAAVGVLAWVGRRRLLR